MLATAEMFLLAVYMQAGKEKSSMGGPATSRMLNMTTKSCTVPRLQGGHCMCEESWATARELSTGAVISCSLVYSSSCCCHPTHRHTP